MYWYEQDFITEDQNNASYSLNSLLTFFLTK